MFKKQEHLGRQLDNYFYKLSKVQILRSPKREGLIKARIRGANIASGDVLIFLDSHSETTEGEIIPI